MQYGQARTIADAIFPRLDSDSQTVVLVRDLTLMFGFAGLVAVCAQIAVRLPWTTVPVTGQTFAVLVAGGALGAWRGAGSLTIYAALGMLGVPVFAPGSGVTAGEWDVHFVLPWRGTEAYVWEISSGGYIVGFILAAWTVGFLAERGWDRQQWVHLAMLLGNVALYLPGLLWLYHLIDTGWVVPGTGKPLAEFIAGTDSLDKTLKGGLYPFIVGDLMKLLLASTALPGAWLLVEKLSGRSPR